MTGTEPLTDFALFAGLSDAQRALVAQAARDVEFPAGTRLFEEGQPAYGCWLIRSGRVSLATSVPGRGQVVVQTLGPGEILGWSWLVSPRLWHLTATAVDETTAIELDTERLRVLAEEDPALGYPLALGLFEVLLMRLQSTRARLLDLYGSPRER
jgi:CRP/FNR family cyclic AMP-dependent transcriptional regulator